MKIQMTIEQMKMVRRRKAKDMTYGQIGKNVVISMVSIAITLCGEQVRPRKSDD